MKVKIKKAGGQWWHIVTDLGWVIFKTKSLEKAKKWKKGVEDMQSLYKLKK